ncbi:glycosyltransferase family 4 protein [Lunatimonas salinarum]|uniref:glycosyltransferase family 4 protein n=1 Tax=Lunatimonas salinarum TaxID=1774590 RepID=UPI001AE09CD1|nr:glycosyltransferase family 4 protein [Lunatimonas salinarum]
MEYTYDLWKMGKGGSHHVWGKVELDQGNEIAMSILPHQKYKFLDVIGDKFGIRHLDHQIRIFFSGSKYDIIYAPYSTANTKFLLYLKWLGLFRKPLVVAIHQPFLGTNSTSKLRRSLSKSLLTAYDGVIFLSEALKDHTLRQLDLPKELENATIFTAQWGPEKQFYKRLPELAEDDEEPYLISAGLTSRDYTTLVEAFRSLPYKLVIYAPVSAITDVGDLPPNVVLHSGFVPYHELLSVYQKSKAVLIPLKYPLKKQGCQGMTSLQDVIALSKPVIITETPTLNLDVEKEGIGLTVPMGDVEGWVSAVRKLMENEPLRQEMIEKTKDIFENRFNMDVYAERLTKILSFVYAKKKGKIRKKDHLDFNR